MPPLPDDQITARLAELPAWERHGDEIITSYELPTFLEAIAFVNRVAGLAEAADHHPDLDIRWRTVTAALTTHDQGGLTTKDFDLAASMDATSGVRG